MRDAISGAIIMLSIAQKWAWLGKKFLARVSALLFTPYITLTFKHPPTLNPAYPPEGPHLSTPSTVVISDFIHLRLGG